MKQKFCACGCGGVVKPGNQFINHHNLRTDKYYELQEDPKLCECGCGGYAKSGNRFIHGHSRKNIILSDDQKSKISESVTTAWRDYPDTHKDGIEKQRGGQDLVKHHYIYDHSDLTKYTMLVTRKQHNTIHRCLRASGNVVPHINIRGL